MHDHDDAATSSPSSNPNPNANANDNASGGVGACACACGADLPLPPKDAVASVTMMMGEMLEGKGIEGDYRRQISGEMEDLEISTRRER